MLSALRAKLLAPAFAVALSTVVTLPDQAKAAPLADPAPPVLLSARWPSRPQTSTAFDGMPQFGELVWQNPDGSPGAQRCSAVTVDSAGGDLVATAAHCIGGVKVGIGDSQTVAYLPGAYGNSQPYGVWYPTQIIRSREWSRSENPDFDIAFLTVHQPGNSRTLESMTGAERFGGIPASGTLGVQIGYPYGGRNPVACRTRIRFEAPTQLQLNCANFPSGTSGGPILTNVEPADGIGTLVGVVGGYQTGGAHSYISYAAALTPAIRGLYRQAAMS